MNRSLLRTGIKRNPSYLLDSVYHGEYFPITIFDTVDTIVISDVF